MIDRRVDRIHYIISYLDYYEIDKDRSEKLNKETDRIIITYLYLINLD